MLFYFYTRLLSARTFSFSSQFVLCYSLFTGQMLMKLLLAITQPFFGQICWNSLLVVRNPSYDDYFSVLIFRTTFGGKLGVATTRTPYGLGLPNHPLYSLIIPCLLLSSWTRMCSRFFASFNKVLTSFPPSPSANMWLKFMFLYSYVCSYLVCLIWCFFSFYISYF